MPDGLDPTNQYHVESTTPVLPHYSFAPVNFREIVQRQISSAVGREVDSAMSLSIGDFDGRFLGNYPGKTQKMENAYGYFYHVVGVSVGGDLSVAAP
jgi:hypothetical protein